MLATSEILTTLSSLSTLSNLSNSLLDEPLTLRVLLKGILLGAAYTVLIPLAIYTGLKAVYWFSYAILLTAKSMFPRRQWDENGLIRGTVDRRLSEYGIEGVEGIEEGSEEDETEKV